MQCIVFAIETAAYGAYLYPPSLHVNNIKMVTRRDSL